MNAPSSIGAGQYSSSAHRGMDAQSSSSNAQLTPTVLVADASRVVTASTPLRATENSSAAAPEPVAESSGVLSYWSFILEALHRAQQRLKADMSPSDSGTLRGEGGWTDSDPGQAVGPSAGTSSGVRLASRLVMVSVPAPVRRLDTLLEIPGFQMDVCWRTPVSTREGAEVDGSGETLDHRVRRADEWSSIGIGIAEAFEMAGGERFEQLQQQVRRSLSELLLTVHPQCIALWNGQLPSLTSMAQDTLLGSGPLVPRCFGGLSFDEEESQAQPWLAFGQGYFVMPRWTYSNNTSAACLTLTVRLDSETSLDSSSDLVQDLEQALKQWARWLALESAGSQHAGIAGPATNRVAHEMTAEGGSSNATEENGVVTPVVTQLAEATWSDMVEAVRRDIKAGLFRKVVLARRAEVVSSQSWNVEHILAYLMQHFGSCTVFAFRRGDYTFLGATPEKLLTLHSSVMSTEALAGSSLSTHDAAARELLENPKDREEHRLVVEEIEKCLGPLCDDLEVPSSPGIRHLRHVLHLQTPIRGRLKRETHVLKLVKALHPTPAVGGVPSKEAKALIRLLEPVERGWYAGPVGWFDGRGDGAFWVALRSAVICRTRAWLYAGAGIMQDSDPHHEYLETALKQRAILSALGVGT